MHPPNIHGVIKFTMKNRKAPKRRKGREGEWEKG
jgi:hypothetical protein